ncbi:hypothetical protein INR49_010752 [Caranx melampygus]|nr:hypothetical protein INR49_010752 [Caranx melampygus]
MCDPPPATSSNLGWSDDGGDLGKEWREGLIWRSKKLRGLRGYGSTWPAGGVHLLAEVKVKHPLWWNCMSLIRRMDWIWGWKAQKSL